ncbi:MAG: YbjN domain-containing protein [Planctomycetota bacterium]|nr:YbjN domain-containing protein [Planctomycetota bacterium]
MILAGSEISSARIKPFFDAALLNCDMKQDGSLLIEEGWVRTGVAFDTNRKLMIYFSIWPVKTTATEAEKLQLVNTLNRDVMCVRFFLRSPSTVVCDYTVSYEKGLSPSQILASFRRYLRAVQGGLMNRDARRIVGFGGNRSDTKGVNKFIELGTLPNVSMFKEDADLQSVDGLLVGSQLDAVKVGAVFHLANLRCEVKPDGKLMVEDAGVKTLVYVDAERRLITYVSVWLTKSSVPEIDKFQLVNTLNRDLIFVRFHMLSSTELACTYQLPFERGVSADQLLAAFRVYFGVVRGGLRTKDPKHIVGADESRSVEDDQTAKLPTLPADAMVKEETATWAPKASAGNEPLGGGGEGERPSNRSSSAEEDVSGDGNRQTRPVLAEQDSKDAKQQGLGSTSGGKRLRAKLRQPQSDSSGDEARVDAGGPEEQYRGMDHPARRWPVIPAVGIALSAVVAAILTVWHRRRARGGQGKTLVVRSFCPATISVADASEWLCDAAVVSADASSATGGMETGLQGAVDASNGLMTFLSAADPAAADTTSRLQDSPILPSANGRAATVDGEDRLEEAMDMLLGAADGEPRESLRGTGRPACAASDVTAVAARVRVESPRFIFGSEATDEMVVGTVSCPNCGRGISYRLRDIGSRPSCPACHRHVLRIGESLLDGGLRPVAEKDGKTGAPAVLVFPGMRWRWHYALPLALAVAAVMVATFAPVSQMPSDSRIPAGTIALRASERAGDFEEADVLAGGAPPEEISLQAIVGLLGRDDALAALQQAESWQQVLRDYGIGDSDSRMVKLAEIVEKLRQRTRLPPVPAPPWIDQFPKELQALRDALRVKNIAAAKAALGRLDKLFREHQEDLTHYGRSLVTLKARLDQLVRIQDGPATIRRLLDQATKELEREQATPAAECLGRAKFLTLGVPLKDDEFALIDKDVRRIERELRFVRGKLAVASAEECLTLNDAVARDAMVRLALDLLPDLPASRVRNLTNQAREVEKRPIPNSQPTPRGRAMIYRMAYEDALQFYGRDKKLREVTDACLLARNRLETMPDPDGREGAKLSDLVLTALEFEVGNLAEKSITAPDLPGRLSDAKIALEKAVPWRGSPRWVAARATVAAREEEIGRAAIARAQLYAAKRDYQRASEVIAPALNLGSPQTRERAASLGKQWEHLVAQEKEWQEVQDLVAEGKAIEAWVKFRTFEERFPSFFKDKVNTFGKDLYPKAAEALKLLIQQTEKQMAQKDWGPFRISVEQLHSLQTHNARYDAQLERLNAEADLMYQQVKANPSAGTPQQVAALLEKLSEIIEKNPNHPEAGAWYRQTKASGQRMAESLLRALRVASYKGPEYRTRLELVKRLDPDGEFGAEADRLLREDTKHK